jgi:chaperonin GroES
MPKGVEHASELKTRPLEDRVTSSSDAERRWDAARGTPIMASELKIRPLEDRVVVEPLEAEEKTPGGILLPDTAREKPQRGRVLAVGPGKVLDDGKRQAMAVAVGDEVLYGRYAGNEVKVNDKDLKIMRESDLLAKVVK